MLAVTEPEEPSAPPPAPKNEPEPLPEPALTPAQPEPEELATRPSYMPRLPWIAGLALVITMVTGYSFYQAREAQRADELRRQLLTTHHEQLAEISERYQQYRSRLERWTMEAAAAGEPEHYVDPRLRISGLHDGSGLYLRIRASDAATPESIARGALSMEEDALTRCLGIAPDSARGLYEHGDFLMPEWADAIERERDFLHLRVMDEQLARHITADVPVISTMMQARYFLLVLQQGDNRRDAPVDVFLWDIASETRLLAARIQADGVLLPVSIRSMVPEAPEAPSPSTPPSMTSGGAHDCSIAAQIKALTGEAPVAVRSVPEVAVAPEPTVEPDAGELPPGP
jgi:hypothetical protein